MAERRTALPAFADAAVRPGEDEAGRGGDLWCLDTINPTGWTAAAAYLRHTAADAVCIQEHWRCAGLQCTEAVASARSAKWSLSLGPSLATEAGAASAGVGVAARTHFGLGLPGSAPLQPVHVSRVHAARFPGVVRGGVLVISAYFWTAQSIASAQNRAMAEALMELIDSFDGPWVIGGDWQVPPKPCPPPVSLRAWVASWLHPRHPRAASER